MYKQLEEIGIQVMDNNGEFRKTKDVLNDLSNVWSKLNKRQKKRFIKNVVRWNLK